MTKNTPENYDKEHPQKTMTKNTPENYDKVHPQKTMTKYTPENYDKVQQKLISHLSGEIVFLGGGGGETRGKYID